MTTTIAGQLSAEMTLNEITAAVPQSLAVFNRLGLDSCCGGAKTLALVAEKHRLDLDAVLKELRAL